MLRRLPRACLGSLAAFVVLATSGAPAAAVPHLDHIVVVVMENKSYDQVRVLPYAASLISQYTSFSSSYGITHPSQPNYLAMWAGLTLASNDNCPPLFSPYGDENLGHACEGAGLRWRSYAEDLPAVGSDVCATAGNVYLRRHCPWTDFSNLDHDNERPYADLAVDIANDSLPNLAYVIPNNCDNSHNSGCTAAFGDTWLSNNVPAMLSAVGPNGLVIVTWDEDDSHSGNHILTLFCGPRVDSAKVSTRYVSHYTVLRTIIEALQLAPFGQAINDSAITDVWKPDLVGVGGPPPGLRLALSPPMPNPSRGSLSATLELSEPTWVEAAIFDASGRPVRRLESGFRSGTSVLRWDGRRDDRRLAATGLYFIRVRAGANSIERKAILLH